MNKKTIMPGIVAAIIAIVAVSLLAPTSFQQISAKTPITNLLDFSAEIPLQTDVKRGETIKIPVDIYGGTKSRDVDIVVTGSDLKQGAISADTTHPQLPQGFSIDLPIKHTTMQAMDEKTAHEKPIMRVDMTVSVDNTVKPGVYAFAIHMIDDNPLGSEGSQISYFYLNVE